MKKSIFTMFLVLSIVFTSYVYGASNKITANKTSVNVGDTIVVTAIVSDVASWNMSISASGPVTFVSGSTKDVNVTDDAMNGTKSISATYKSTGVGDAVFTLSGDSTTQTNQKVTLSSNCKVSIKEKVTQTPTTPTNPTTNGNANLKRLVPNYEGISPNFNPDVTKYSLTVPSTATSVKLDVQVAQQGAKYWISGDENLKIGDNTVTITVTATNGTKKNYIIIVTRADNVEKANAYLDSIAVDVNQLSPEFSPQVFEYDLGNIAADVGNIEIVAFAKSEKATIEITGNKNLIEGENTINIKVTAEDGVTTKNYIIKLNKEKTAIIVEDDDLVVPINVEVNPYNDVDTTKSSGFNNFISSIRENLLYLLLLALVLVEFAQIVYYYMKDRKEKENKPDALSKNKREINKDNNNDKYSDTRRRARASVDESLNNISVTTQNNNDEIQNIEEEKVEDNSFVQEKDEFDNSDELNHDSEEISESNSDNQDE